jgi:two-component system KDP operon response regulator KdpE
MTMKILIVGNDSEAAEYIRLAFKVGLPEVALTSINPKEEAVAVVEQESPDIVILDKGLAEGDGSWVLKQIRCLPSAPKIIIAAGSGDRMKELDLDEDKCEVRPIELEEILDRVKAINKARRGK